MFAGLIVSQNIFRITMRPLAFSSGRPPAGRDRGTCAFTTCASCSWRSEGQGIRGPGAAARPGPPCSLRRRGYVGESN